MIVRLVAGVIVLGLVGMNIWLDERKQRKEREAERKRQGLDWKERK